jgi:hypothetical protein
LQFGASLRIGAQRVVVCRNGSSCSPSPPPAFIEHDRNEQQPRAVSSASALIDYRPSTIAQRLWDRAARSRPTPMRFFPKENLGLLCGGSEGA